jgi:hypothetical protein
MPLFSNSQKIQKNAFDPIDSIYTISTKEEVLSGKLMRKDYLAFECNYADFRAGKYKSLENTKYLSVQFSFRIISVTSFDQKSIVKIQFDDNVVKEYNNTN